MFPKKPVDVVSLEAARREALRVVLENPVGSDPYNAAMESVEKLSTLIVKESREPLSWNAVLPVVGTIASVLMITDFEKLNVVTSKAVQFLPKLLK